MKELIRQRRIYIVKRTPVCSYRRVYFMKIKVDILRHLIEETNFDEKFEWAEKLEITQAKLNSIVYSGEVASQIELFDLCKFFGVTPTDLEERERTQVDFRQREADGNFIDVVNNEITPIRPFSVLEVFAGAGGLMLGLEEAGLETAAALEIDKHACNTLRANRPELNVIEGDIADIVKDGIRNYVDGEIDVLSGGYPCQAFSFAGKKLGLKDARGTMFYWYAQLLNELRPKMFLAENVRGLVSHEKGETLQGMIDVFDDLGYNVTWKVLKATNYNVAQKRERIFIIGVRKDFANVQFQFPAPRDHIPVLRDVLQNVPDSPGQKYPPRKKEIMDMVPPGGYWRDLPDEIQREYMGGSYFLGGGKTGIARRISWDEPSLTLTTSPAMKQTERCHPDETRPFTTREYARIQSFPDSWHFEGSMNQVYKQVGNAVPVELARHVGLAMVSTLNQIVGPNLTEYGDNENRRLVEQMALF